MQASQVNKTLNRIAKDALLWSKLEVSFLAQINFIKHYIDKVYTHENFFNGDARERIIDFHARSLPKISLENLIEKQAENNPDLAKRYYLIGRTALASILLCMLLGGLAIGIYFGYNSWQSKENDDKFSRVMDAIFTTLLATCLGSAVVGGAELLLMGIVFACKIGIEALINCKRNNDYDRFRIQKPSRYHLFQAKTNSIDAEKLPLLNAEQTPKKYMEV